MSDVQSTYASDYLWPVLRPDAREKVVKGFIRYLKRVMKKQNLKFDTVVCRGTSGLLVAPIIAHMLNKHLIVSRKPKEDSHSSDSVEGYRTPKRYIIVDDLICRGDTVNNILRHMEECRPEAECVAIFLYRSDSVDETYRMRGGDKTIPRFNQSVSKIWDAGEVVPGVKLGYMPEL